MDASGASTNTTINFFRETLVKLYYFPLSTYSQKVLIALYEKAIEFESEITNLIDAHAREKYRNVYPMGKIPLLMDDNEYMVPESSIIIEYLDQLKAPKMIFGDATQQRQIRFKDRIYDLYLAEPVTTLLFQNMKPEDNRDAERIDTARRRINTMYMFMDQELAQQRFSNGSEFSMSDCAAAAGLFYARREAPFDDYPNVCRYWERLLAKPSVQRVHEEAEPYLAELTKRTAA